jgi:hypothetical protein
MLETQAVYQSQHYSPHSRSCPTIQVQRSDAAVPVKIVSVQKSDNAWTGKGAVRNDLGGMLQKS